MKGEETGPVFLPHVSKGTCQKGPTDLGEFTNQRSKRLKIIRIILSLVLMVKNLRAVVFIHNIQQIEDIILGKIVPQQFPAHLN